MLQDEIKEKILFGYFVKTNKHFCVVINYQRQGLSDRHTHRQTNIWTSVWGCCGSQKY